MSRPSGPRIRSVKPERYQDERFAGVTRDARHLYDGLTCRADDEGRGTANADLLRGTLLPFDHDATPDKVTGWLDELNGADLVELYDVDGRTYFAITSWSDDQRIDKPTPSKLPTPPSLATPHEESTNAREESTKPPEPLASAPALARAGGPDQDQDQDQDRPPAAAGETPRDDVRRLCHLLADLLTARNSKAKVKPDSTAWTDPCRLLLDSDGRSEQEVEQVIRWCQHDTFWQSNIRSTAKLREKFDQLWDRMTPAQPTAPAPDSRFDQYDDAARRRAGHLEEVA